MDIRKLYAFIETVRAGSINAAADQLGYTQSGLTYVLRSLEEELNVQLLDRTPKGIALSAKGREVFPYINSVVEKMNELNNKIVSLSNQRLNRKETIRLAAYPSTTINWISKEIPAFLDVYPMYNIDMRVGVNMIPLWVEEGSVDIGIVERGLASGLAVSHKWTFLRKEEFCAIFPKDCPLADKDAVTLKMLTDYRMILPALNEKNCVMAEISRQKIEFKDQVSVRVEDGSVMFSLVGNGYGVSFLSSQYKIECPENVCMRPFMPPIERDLGMLTNHDIKSGKTGAALLAKWLYDNRNNNVY